MAQKKKKDDVQEEPLVSIKHSFPVALREYS